MGSGKKYREGNYSYYYMYIYLYVGFHWPVWSVSTQFPSLQDAPDLGWDYKFVDNVTDLLTWVHVKGRNTSSYTAPDPRLSQHTGNIIGYGSFLCLPCLPTPPPHSRPATALASALLSKAPAPTSQSVRHSQLGRTTDFLGRKAILPSWRVIPKRTDYLFSPRQT